MQSLIVDSIQDIKGERILILDLRHIEEAPADYFIICEGESTTKVSSIASNIQRRTKEELQVRPNHTEGERTAQWVLLDYFDVVVHVFYPDMRAFYDLEELWSDAKITEIPALA